MKYYPFGETRSGGTPTDRRFTGQRAESGLGSLYDYNARFYSPVLGRFLSADTIVPSSNNPQSLNRYSYVYNSPLNFTDPSGHCPKNDRLCEIIVKNIKDTYGIILQDDTAVWQGGKRGRRYWPNHLINLRW
jgi:RHS repeat-associated protein